MKSKYLFLALSAMALVTGCSNDETIEVNQGNGIDFSVTAGKLTRAQATTTTSINQFKVWAFTGTPAQLYMDNIMVNKTDDKWTYSGTKFWPETSVDFFAVSPASPQSGTVTVNTSEKKITDYVVNGAEDLLYSMNAGETKDDHKSSPVNINFRHALSQIVFMVKKTETSSINVSIQSIKVDGVASKSTLEWATNTTGPNMASDESKDTETDNTWGIWTTPTDNTSYTAFSLTTAYPVTTTASYLTTEAGNGALFLMPQKLNEWLSVVNGETKITGTARLLINCKITDVTSGIQLWPKTGDFGVVAVSLTNPTNDPNKTDADDHARWMQGKKYIYTLIFGEGAGYDPDPDPDPEDPDKPEPVLVPITFTVTVDEFQEGGSYDINMSTK